MRGPHASAGCCCWQQRLTCAWAAHANNAHAAVDAVQRLHELPGGQARNQHCGSSCLGGLLLLAVNVANIAALVVGGAGVERGHPCDGLEVFAELRAAGVAI